MPRYRWRLVVQQQVERSYSENTSEKEGVISKYISYRAEVAAVKLQHGKQDILAHQKVINVAIEDSCTEELDGCLETHLEEGIRVGTHAHPAHALVLSLECLMGVSVIEQLYDIVAGVVQHSGSMQLVRVTNHVVGDERQMAVVDLDAVHPEYASQFLDGSGTSCFDAVCLGHGHDVVTSQLAEINDILVLPHFLASSE